MQLIQFRGTAYPHQALTMGIQTLTCRCCIAGGGPAGMMLGLLLARCGTDVVVLEKHADFFRDFRGDTVHPSTMEVMHELGLLERFLARPHDQARTLQLMSAGKRYQVADFSHVRTRCQFIAMMPQWEFLDFIRDEAGRYPQFRLIMNADACALIEAGGQVRGVKAITPEGTLHVLADLVVAADGRHSVLRKEAGLTVRDLGASIDVLWMRIPAAAGDPVQTGGIIGNGHFFVMIHRTAYWQCAYVIPKGGAAELHANGLDRFRTKLARIAPFFRDRLDTIASWDDVKLLSVKVDRLERWWKPGLLCIGDAAHAMSPVGGVGVNLAIQDAVATANILGGHLSQARLDPEAITSRLAQVQRRRMLPTRLTQRTQLGIHNRLLVPTLSGREDQAFKVPWQLAALNRWPLLQALPAYAVGIGVRPEHVRMQRQAR